MKLIAHRGNIDGPNPLEENRPEYIEEAIARGYDVEIDVRYDTFDKKLYLGHDEPQYAVNWTWFGKYVHSLWVHCKNIEALYEFAHGTSGFNYFWHQEDDFTLTSRNYIWSYPGKTYTPKSIIVMPEWNIKVEKFNELLVYGCHGICSDYVGYISKKGEKVS
jgi:hypothetical protein